MAFSLDTPGNSLFCVGMGSRRGLWWRRASVAGARAIGADQRPLPPGLDFTER